MVTKHEQIIQYIESLEVGTKISVRRVATAMGVSEGTAYRAIKESEALGIVSTIERVGTVRIEKKQKANIEKLTFAEIVNVVDGNVLGGSSGLHKTLNKFVIGAMTEEAMLPYIEAGSLLIVGNRYEAHKLSLRRGAAVLITGGFETSQEVTELADELQLPVISCSYDTYTVAAMINRAIYDQLIKKDILLVEDIVSDAQTVYSLKIGQKVAEWHRIAEESGHGRYPVVDSSSRVVGMITPKDIVGVDEAMPIEKAMTRNPLTVSKQTSVASAAHMFVWEGIELLPVVDQDRKLTNVISRQDVLKALQYHRQQPHIGETIEDVIMAQITELTSEEGKTLYRCKITPQMSNKLGSVSAGVLTSLMTDAGFRVLKNHKKGDMIIENFVVYTIKPVQIESEVTVYPRVIDISRKYGKVDIEVFYNQQLVAKAMMTAQSID